MPKQMVEVDVPEMWEAVEVRAPRLGEQFFLSPNQMPALATREYHFSESRIILRPAWQWPAGIKAEWMAVESRHDRVILLDAEPTLSEDGHYRSAGGRISILDPAHIAFDLPPEKNAKRQNPNPRSGDAAE